MNSFSKTITSFPLHFFFFFVLLISITQRRPLAATHGCHEEERRALLNFKSSLEDPSNRLSSWQEISNQHQNCCNWHGIQCSNESSHVISIDLRNIQLENHQYEYKLENHRYFTQLETLRGKLSPSLFQLTHLEYLDLGFNDFGESDISNEFSYLTKLAHLDLSNSNFSAYISTQFNNLSNLQYLDLSCVFPSRNGFNLYTTACLR
ncbi:hypothetical protein MKW92_011669 [Papaver armeniacum]|nr:hypothetical protein MKW92_011669 [Papaver armeniacum]